MEPIDIGGGLFSLRSYGSILKLTTKPEREISNWFLRTRFLVT